MKILFKRKTTFFKWITSAIRTDKDFFERITLVSNGWRFYSNIWPQPFEQRKIFVEWIAAAVRTTRNFSQQMIQSIRTAFHQSRTDHEQMTNGWQMASLGFLGIRTDSRSIRFRARGHILSQTYAITSKDYVIYREKTQRVLIFIIVVDHAVLSTFSWSVFFYHKGKTTQLKALWAILV